jgi:hypothetical protein
MADSVTQTNLSAGELSPNLYGRTDLAKYHNGAMLMRNIYVDYRGGGSSRQGTQFLNTTAGNATGRLKRFVFSASQTYMLVFTNGRLEFIRNPLTVGHINGSNAGFIESSPGVRYFISTPYATADLPHLKFSQSADVMIITHPSYTQRQLIRVSDTNWVLSIPTINTAVVTPTNLVAAITALPAGSTDPQNTNYNYVVTAVGLDGQESQPSAAASITGINIAATQGTITLRWAASAGAVYYNVYKAIPSPGAVLVGPTASFGFVGTAYGTEFTDSNIIADFSETPPRNNNPLANGRVIDFVITAGGATYPVGATTATITDPNGATASIIPVLSTNTAGGTGSVIGFVIRATGAGIANGAAIVVTGAGGAGFTGTVVTSPATGAEPAVSAYFQQRRIYAGSNNAPTTLNGSRVAYYNNFDISNPVVDSDAYQFTIAGQEVNVIRHLLSMPGGLVIFSDGGVVQLTGGSSNPTNPAAVTPSSVVIVPQSYYGASDVPPIVINYDILYVQSQGSIVRDLAYNFFVNIYTGSDLTLLSSHFFFPRFIADWAYQDVPNKIIWAIRDDGLILALTYLKDQEIYGWTQHNTQGTPISVENVREGTEDAIYFIILRNGNYCIERLAGRTFYDSYDPWCLDSALFLPKTFPAATLTPGAGAEALGAVNISFQTDVAVFGAGDVGKRIKGYGNYGLAEITAFIGTTSVLCTIISPFGFNSTLTAPQSLPPNGWCMMTQTSAVSGLSHLNGLAVFARVDGGTQGPFFVAGGAITLTTPGYDIVVGLKYIPQLQQLPSEDPPGVLKGKRSREVSTRMRVMNTGPGLKIGNTFTTLRSFIPLITSTDTPWNVPYLPNGLGTGEIGLNLPAAWDTQGGICLQMDDPQPFTILSISTEIEGVRS